MQYKSVAFGESRMRAFWPQENAERCDCGSQCRGRQRKGRCLIHFPDLHEQGVDLRVPAVCWDGKWWVIDAACADRLAKKLRTSHD